MPDYPALFPVHLHIRAKAPKEGTRKKDEKVNMIFPERFCSFKAVFLTRYTGFCGFRMAGGCDIMLLVNFVRLKNP